MVFAKEQPLKWLSPQRSPQAQAQMQFFHDEGDKDKLAWFQMSSKQSPVKSPKAKDILTDEETLFEGGPLSSLDSSVDYDALEYADRLEMGLSREIVSNVMMPVRSVNKLERYNVLSSENMTEYRMLSDDFAFVLFARLNAEERRVDIYQYDPKDQGNFDGTRPAFTLSYNSAKTHWNLVQERCQCCQYSPKHLSCAGRSKQQVACVRHYQKKLGHGVSNCMEVKIPGFRCDGTPVIWCTRSGRPDLSSPSSPSRRSSGYGDSSPGSPGSPIRDAEVLTTKLPVWNEEFECLVLDFEGRTVTASPHNFQLANWEETDELVCQYGKIGPNTFSLDFKRPLSVIQAFGVSLSTMFLA